MLRKPLDITAPLKVFYTFAGPGALSQLQHVFELLRAAPSSTLTMPDSGTSVAGVMRSLKKNNASLHLHHLEPRLLLIHLHDLKKQIEDDHILQREANNQSTQGIRRSSYTLDVMAKTAHLLAAKGTDGVKDVALLWVTHSTDLTDTVAKPAGRWERRTPERGRSALLRQQVQRPRTS